MQRFQVTYHLKVIPEVQEYLNVALDNSKHHGDLQDLYRRRYVDLYFHDNFLYSLWSKVFWLNQRIPQIPTLPAICDSSLVGQLVSNLRPRRHHSNNITRTHHLFFMFTLFFLYGECKPVFISLFFPSIFQFVANVLSILLCFFRCLSLFIASTQ